MRYDLRLTHLRISMEEADGTMGPSAVGSTSTSATHAVPWSPQAPASGSRPPRSAHLPLPDPPNPATPAERGLKAGRNPVVCQTARPAGCFPKTPGGAPRPKLWVCAGGSGGCGGARSGRATPRLGAAPGLSAWGGGRHLSPSGVVQPLGSSIPLVYCSGV